LFSQTYHFTDYIFEHVRLALQTRAWSAKLGVTWENFFENVLPYAVINEQRDLWWRWRPRFKRLYSDLVQSAKTVTEAVRLVATAVPQTQAEGTFALTNEDSGEVVLQPGPPFSWKSETSPGYLSPYQVAQNGGSCTGTGILLVLACRSAGIPARLAGCSESYARGDDHHWIEFWDNSNAGPFGDNWHTKEGVSRGNPGGPWDSPSGPMGGCLQGVVLHSTMDTLWSSAWSAPDNLPTLWSNTSWAEEWAFIGGINRCGAYCSAWGCSPDRSKKWKQEECGP